MLNQLRPYPESFGASVNGRSHLESIVLIEEDSVKDVALSSSIFSDNSYYGDVFFLVGLVEPIDGFLVYDDF